MISFVLGILLFGGVITAISLHVMDQALAESGLSAQDAESIGRQFTRTLTGFTIIGMVVALLVAAFLSRTISEPIQRLLAGVREIAQGHLDKHIDMAGDDELGRLAVAFNDMAQTLKQSHDHLESTVTQRTAELTDANQHLQTEIAERWRAEAALRAGERRLQTILDSIVAGVLIIDSESHFILDVNGSAAKQIGLPKSEIIGKLCYEFICPAECGKCPITDLGQTVDHSERILLKADGSSYPIIKSVTKAIFQGRECLIESFVEITEQKKAEEDLRETISLLETTLESTADGILVTDRKGLVKNYNKRCIEVTGLPTEVLESQKEGQALSLMLEHVKDPSAFQARNRYLETQCQEDSLDIVELKNGRIIEYYSKACVVDGQIAWRVWSLRDITENRRAQQVQDELLSQVAEINEELSHFAYVVSHDLKAPLRGIKLITEWLCEDYGDILGGEGTEQLELLQNRVERMHNLIEGVLQYSRVGRIKEKHTAINLNTLVSTVVDMVAPPEHVDVVVEGQLPEIKCEKTRIMQVFQNLISNAIKYMDKPEGQVVIACSDDEDMWTFRVSDNGPGIEAKYHDRIFKIFQTLSARDEFESTGLGLTLVKKIVELYGGKIWVESEIGQGSTFFFTFPKTLIESKNDALEGKQISGSEMGQDESAPVQNAHHPNRGVLVPEILPR